MATEFVLKNVPVCVCGIAPGVFDSELIRFRVNERVAVKEAERDRCDCARDPACTRRSTRDVSFPLGLQSFLQLIP
jgi:hypothetical protein